MAIQSLLSYPGLCNGVIIAMSELKNAHAHSDAMKLCRTLCLVRCKGPRQATALAYGSPIQQFFRLGDSGDVCGGSLESYDASQHSRVPKAMSVGDTQRDTQPSFTGHQKPLLCIAPHPK